MKESPHTTTFKVNNMTQYETDWMTPAEKPAQDRIYTDKTANPEKMLKLRAFQAEMFKRISLEETNKKASLLDRVESKYLLSGAQYGRLLRELADSYSVLEVCGTAVSSYETSYYDDDRFTLYYQHHNGRSDRYKLRLRHYLSSGEHYLEVKHKTNRGATLKSRINVDGVGDREVGRFLTEKFPYEASRFRPVLKTVYTRMTLVSDEGSERITFDTDLRFMGAGGCYDCGDLVIAESKHERLANTPAQKKMKELSVRKASFSKYCVGAALLNRGLKSNRFKPKLLYLSRTSATGLTGLCGNRITPAAGGNFSIASTVSDVSSSAVSGATASATAVSGSAFNRVAVAYSEVTA